MNRTSGDDKYVIVVSYDAFSQDNWEIASKLPNLASLIGAGAYSTRLRSVYPTLTYVIHATFVTGVYPDKHGVVHNNPLQPFVEEKNQRWHWYRSDIAAPTVYDAVRKHGMTTASLLWPVTGKASITYNIPEVRAINNENQALKVLKNGSPLYSLGMELKYGRYRRGIRQPELDDFTTRCAADTIKRKKPNLLLMHLIDLDDAKHARGTKGPHMQQVMERMDRRLGQLIRAVDEAGIRDRTTFIVAGDHGHKDVRYKMYLNRLFYEQGLIYEEDGRMAWRAYVQGAGGSAYLHVREGDDRAEEQAVRLIEQAMSDDRLGIECLYTGEELERYRTGPAVRYMLEAKTGYCFEDDYDKPSLVDLAEQGEVYSTHGYSPDKEDYTSVLVMSGPDIKRNYSFGDVEAVDLAPTIAEILNIRFGPCDGRVLRELFAK